MMKVVAEWPITMKQHLLRGSNDLAHIGHCAACMAHGLPEYITREAWGMLSPEQQDSANARAMEALDVYQATSFAQHASEAFQLEMWPHYDARG
jgi:hypothetical protein